MFIIIQYRIRSVVILKDGAVIALRIWEDKTVMMTNGYFELVYVEIVPSSGSSLQITLLCCFPNGFM